MSAYPECDRHSAAVPQTQPAGEFVEWLRSEKHVHLMTFGKYTDLQPCWQCGAVAKPEGLPVCYLCGGRLLVEIEHEGYISLTQSLETLLAEWQSIDLAKVEAERRTMLAKLAGGEMP